MLSGILTKSKSYIGFTSKSLQKLCRVPFSTQTNSKYVTKVEGTNESRRIYYYVDGQDKAPISPWHNIPYKVSVGIYNYVNEIPKGTRAKNEIATGEELNPIKQDVKNGKLRYFTYGKIPFNYGAIPQTWEDPSIEHSSGFKGDNDPLDVVEISPGPLGEGEVVEIKVLGALALIDEGELDWKIIGINAKSPLATLLDNTEDIGNVLPGMDATIREWFRNYKTTDGKPKNEFAFHEKLINKEEAEAVVEETHERWKALVEGQVDAGKLWTQQ